MALNPDNEQDAQAKREEIAVHHEIDSMAELTDRLIADLRRDRPDYLPLILIVEDDPNVSDIEMELFKTMDCLPTVADTGRAAIALIERGYEPDVILLDLKLPDVDGAVVMRAVRRILPEVPVVVVTGFPDSSIMAEVMEMGYVGIITKPLGVADITEILKKHRVQSRHQNGS